MCMYMRVHTCTVLHTHSTAYCASGHSLSLLCIVLTEGMATATTCPVAMEMPDFTLLSVGERHDVIVVTVVGAAIEVAATYGRPDRITM